MTIEIVNHTDREVEIQNFNKARYVDESYLAKEWEHLWRDSWLVAGLASDVELPGDFFVFDLGREQILVTRTQSGDIQGFFNVCQHRGNLLVTEERGQASNFRCGFQLWCKITEGIKSAPTPIPTKTKRKKISPQVE